MDAIKILEAVSEISDTKNISENQIINAFKKSLEQTYKSKVNSAAEVVAIFDKQTGQVGLDRI